MPETQTAIIPGLSTEARAAIIEQQKEETLRAKMVRQGAMGKQPDDQRKRVSTAVTDAHEAGRAWGARSNVRRAVWAIALIVILIVPMAALALALITVFMLSCVASAARIVWESARSLRREDHSSLG